MISANEAKNKAGADAAPKSSAGEILSFMDSSWQRILWLTAFLVPFTYIMALAISELASAVPVLQENWLASAGSIEFVVSVLISVIVVLLFAIFIAVAVVMPKILSQIVATELVSK